MSEFKVCPKCFGTLRVVDSRESTLPGVLRRRRLKCEQCKCRITTHEIVVGEDEHAPETFRLVRAHDNILAAVKEAIAPLLAGLTEEDIRSVRLSRILTEENTT